MSYACYNAAKIEEAVLGMCYTFIANNKRLHQDPKIMHNHDWILAVLNTPWCLTVY